MLLSISATHRDAAGGAHMKAMPAFSRRNAVMAIFRKRLSASISSLYNPKCQYKGEISSFGIGMKMPWARRAATVNNGGRCAGMSSRRGNIAHVMKCRGLARAYHRQSRSRIDSDRRREKRQPIGGEGRAVDKQKLEAAMYLEKRRGFNEYILGLVNEASSKRAALACVLISFSAAHRVPNHPRNRQIVMPRRPKEAQAASWLIGAARMSLPAVKRPRHARPWLAKINVARRAKAKAKNGRQRLSISTRVSIGV